MKIIIVLPSFEFGGIERTTINLIKNLQNIRPVVILHKDIEHYFKDLNCGVYRFEDFGVKNSNLSIQSIYSCSKTIRRISSMEKAQAVFGIMQYSPIYSCLAKDIFRMKAEVIISYRGALSAFFKYIPSFGRWARYLVHYTLKSSSGIITPSEGVKEDLIEDFGAPREKVRVIYNGIDINAVRKMSKDSIDLRKECPWIITSCRLSPQKDLLTLLRAFKIVREKVRSKLLILGQGPLKDSILSWNKDLGIDNDVLLMGFKENPFKYISRADVFVLSSFFEGFGNVIVEAMALGIPVVATDCPSGPGEIIEHGVSGVLVPMRDHKRMAENILNILQDTGLKKRLSEEGVKRSALFSAERMASEYERYFLSLFE